MTLSQAMPRPISAAVEMRHERPTLLLNGTPHAPLLYALSDCPGARWTWEEVPARNIGLFAQQGVRLFQADVWFEQMLTAGDRLDVSLARRQIAGILAACPDAAVMLRLHVNAPPAWCAAHPDECVGYADTTPEDPAPWGLQRPLATDGGRPVRASFASKLWFDWATARLRDFCAQLAATPEGDALFCLQVANGLYGEWHQFGFMHHDPDTGVAATRGFQSWLHRHYVTADALSAAWGRPVLDFTTITTPGSPDRERAECGVVRHPQTQRDVIDYYTFLHEALGDAVIGLARTVKEAWPRPIVTAAFWGYFYGCFGRNAAGAHLDFERGLRSPWLDCLCSPQSYTYATRELGGSGHARGILGVVRRAGKLWLDEMDQPTSVCGCPWDRKFKSTPADDIALMRRNVLQSALRGGGQWWYDFGPVAGTPSFAGQGNIGWWDEPRLQENVGAIHRLIQERVGRPFQRPADVLVVHDAWCFRHLVSRRIPTEGFAFGDPPPIGPDPFSRRAIDDLCDGLYRSGLVPDEALLSELGTLDLTPYRLVIFATTPALDATQREVIQIRVAAEGRHVALLGFAGWSDGIRADAELAANLSGFSTRLVHTDNPVSVLSLAGTNEEQWLEPPLPVAAFAATPEQAIGHWADGTVSAARRPAADATWWTFAVAPTTPAFLRELGRQAGCHVINETDDVTLLGDGLLLIHTLAGGARTLRLPGGREIITTLAPRSTTVFDTTTGTPVLS